ncbi:MAG: hypothetical protein ACLRWT_04205 [Agathobacter rectalis]
MLINYKKEVVTTSFLFLHLCRGTLLQYLPASMIFAVLVSEFEEKYLV